MSTNHRARTHRLRWDPARAAGRGSRPPCGGRSVARRDATGSHRPTPGVALLAAEALSLVVRAVPAERAVWRLAERAAFDPESLVAAAGCCGQVAHVDRSVAEQAARTLLRAAAGLCRPPRVMETESWR